jgi:enoyl-CoA hydratase
MSGLVSYERSGGVSTVTMDDGKVNVFSIPMLSELHEAFDQAQRDETVVLLTGRPGYFSAGFDLKVFDGPADGTLTMLRLGATLAERILSFPTPVAVACSGHAFPAGAFLLMAADTRVGADGAYKLGLNEVRIGLTLPWFAIVLARYRLTPSHFDHAVVTGTMFDPQLAREAGLLDAVVAPEALSEAGLAVAEDLTGVDRRAHAATKLRARKKVLEELREAIDTELSPQDGS